MAISIWSFVDFYNKNHFLKQTKKISQALTRLRIEECLDTYFKKLSFVFFKEGDFFVQV